MARLPGASASCVTWGVDEIGCLCHLMTSVVVISFGSLQFLESDLATVGSS